MWYFCDLETQKQTRGDKRRPVELRAQLYCGDDNLSKMELEIITAAVVFAFNQKWERNIVDVGEI